MKTNDIKRLEKKQEQIFQYAAKFQMALANVFNDEENDYFIEIKNEDITDIVTGSVIGYLSFISHLTRRKGNLHDHLHLVDDILLQYLMQYGRQNDDDDEG